jgi:hypothetical protein
LKIVYSLLVVAVSAAPAFATDARQTVRSACMADVKTICGVLSTRNQVLTCLAKNAATVSDDCKAALGQAACRPEAPDMVKAAFPCPG